MSTDENKGKVFNDLVSEQRLAKLHLDIRAEAIDLAKHIWAQGIRMRVTQGLRTIAEQNALYAQGRTTPGKIVTNAKGGSSYHNYGLAFDFCLIGADGKASWSSTDDTNGDHLADWKQIVDTYLAHGWEWGGNWHTIKDTPHLQKTFGLSIAELNKRSHNGAVTYPMLG